MKKFLLTLIATAFTASLSLAQVGTPADAGLVARTPTIDVNTNYNNGGLETGDIAITANTNVVLAFEDDGDTAALTDFEAVWTLYDRNGNLLTPPVTVTNIVGSACLADAVSVTNMTYRAFFRSNGSPTPGYTGDFGGKAKGNRFGDGFGFGAGTDAIACEVPELLPIQLDDSASGSAGFPSVQFLNNDGSRNTTVGGPEVAGIATFSDADAQADGTIRMADFEYLSNGNILLVGESRQAADQALTGQTGGEVVVYKVLNSSGGVVKAYSLATSDTNATGAWHGAGVTSNGFAIRFNSGGATVRMFDNSGNPTTANINLATATCHPEAGAGGRGDGVGFTGNGKDAYVYACNGAAGPWVTVLNADGSVRYSRKVADAADDATGGGTDRLGADISADGRVIVAFQAANNDPANVNFYGLPQARLFDPCGRAIGPVFYLSERDNAANAISGNGGDGRPRVAFRGNTIAALWGSFNSPDTANIVLALRIFDAPPLAACSPGPSVSVAKSGGNAIISWNASFGNLTLQSTPTLSPSAWACVSPQPAIVPAGSLNTMTVPIGAGNVFFRLQE